MYIICRGAVEVTDKNGQHLKHLYDGEYFGEIGLILTSPRTANVVATGQCDLFILEKSDFKRIMQDNPQFAEALCTLAKERYNVAVSSADLMRT